MALRWKYLLPHFRRAEEREMQEELEALAEIAGRRELGNLTLAAENARAAWGWAWLDGILGDVRYAIRTLRRQRSFTAVAVVSLALGIGANAAIFSLMNAVLWRELPVREPERLVAFENSSRSYFGYTRFAENAGPVMESVVACSLGAIARRLDTGAGAERGTVDLVSGNYFQSLGVRAQIGRIIEPQDDRRNSSGLVAVLSDGYWRRAYAGRPVLAERIRIESIPFTIVGVAPPEFFGLAVGTIPDVWLPVSAVGSVFSGPSWLDGKNTNFLSIFGRLRPGVSVQQAAAALTPVSRQIDIERNGPPASEKDRRKLFAEKLRLVPAGKGISFLRNRFSKPLRVVFWMVAIGLLLACVNTMSLEFARADERRKELAVRLSIGASRWRIVRQLLTESVLLAAAGGAIGMAIHRPLADGILSLITMGGNPIRLKLGIDSGMLLFVCAVSVAAALVSGVLPAVRATRGDVRPGLQQASRATTAAPNRRVLARAVAASQFALSLVLVSGTFLFVYSLHRLRQFEAGVDREHLLVVDVDPGEAGYKDEQLTAVNDRLRERLAAVPGVKSVSFSQNGIYSGRNFETRFHADGFPPEDDRDHHSIYDHVGPYFFTTAGARIISGRDFTAHDNANAPGVAIVTGGFARRVFEGREAVGHNLYVAQGNKTLQYQIVGIAEDIRSDVRRPMPMFYLCQLQTHVQAFSTRFLVRTHVNPTAVIPGLRTAVREENAGLQVNQIDAAEDLFNRTVSTDRLMATLSWGFGVLAIVLAAVGIYGLLSYDVTRRTAEIGIRMAVGAKKSDVVALVMREVAFVCGVGLAVGCAAALALSKLVEGLVFQIHARDPRIEAGAGAVLAAVAIMAAWIPARRAARMDPMTALRSE